MGSKDVEINAVLEDVPKHSIAVINGKASIGAGSVIESAYEDTVVTIVADDAPTGQVFDKWEVISGGVSVANATSATTTFTMLGADVKVKATYKSDDSDHTHTFVWKIDKEATKDETGLKHEECSGCGLKRNENTVIGKLPSGDNTNPSSNTGNKPAKDDSTKSPQTGDTSNFFGFIAFLFVCGGVAIGTTVYNKKKKESEAE